MLLADADATAGPRKWPDAFGTQLLETLPRCDLCVHLGAEQLWRCWEKSSFRIWMVRGDLVKASMCESDMRDGKRDCTVVIQP